MNARLARWLVPAVAVAAGLAIGETLLRSVFHFAPQVDLNIYRRDDVGNLRLLPNLNKQHVTPLWDVSVQTNADGWRDAPSGAAPILGLGDSFAFGWGVEQDEGLYRLLEAELGRKVLNAAVPGTGTVDQAKLLDSVFADAHPEVVVLSLFVGNDFHDTSVGGSMQFFVEGGVLVRRLYHGRAFSQTLARFARRSRILQLLRALQFRYGDTGSDREPRTWDAWMRLFADVHLRSADQVQFDKMTKALDRIEAWCSARGAQLVVVVIPRSWQLDDEELARMMQSLEIDATDLDLDQPQRFLNRWGAGRGVRVVDLLPAFRQAVKEQPNLGLYHTPDAHWTAAGHALAARETAAAVQGNP